MRRSGLTVVLGDLGEGEVNNVLPVERLLSADTVVQAPKTPGSPNTRLLSGIARPRHGYKQVGDRPTTTAVTGLFQALFDNNTTEYLRGDTTAARYLTGGVWTTITAGGTGENWCFAMVRRAGGTTIANQVMLCGGADADDVFRYRGGGAAAAGVATGTFKGARVLIGHRGRLLVMNVYDVGAGARKHARVYYSIVGDPETFTGTGSGFVDLDDDPYPIVGALVVAGNVCVFKGNNIAGGITVGTLTGQPNAPYRWDTINTGNIGLLIPRSLIAISPDMAFFVGHDGFYLYDGGRGLARVGDGVTRNILSRLNPNALKYGHAWYKPVTGEIHVALPTGSATYPTEVWVFNIKDRRVYGPYAYGNTMSAACPYAVTDTLTWDTLPGPSWDTLPYASWDSIGGSASARGVLMGSSDGYTWIDDEATSTDNGSTVIAQYVSGAITPSGRLLTMPNGQQRPLGPEEALTLREVSLIYKNVGEWTPTVEISTDGGNSFTAIDEGTTIGGTSNLNRFTTRGYETALSGTWFQARVTGSTNMELSGIKFDFAYGGVARNE